ncbi:MAG: hypothetical protein JXB30_19430 [Anaerolineae bacterium]|nr:hypothetical protein [Anaerolineae bacterium]
MQRQMFIISLCGFFAAMLLGCNSAPSEVLPTTTPAPTQVILTATTTPLPPPTVTPFPTATPRGEIQPLDNTTVSEDETSETLSDNPGEPAPNPTEVPHEATPTTVAPSGVPDGVNVAETIFSADFYQGWPSTNEGTAKMSIVNGQYLFSIGPFDARLVTTTAVDRRDMYAQVEVTPKQCPAKTGYGLIFRYTDTGNYYLLTIFCDKTFTVGGRDSGSVFGNNNALPEGLDSADPSAHYIGVLAQGDNYTFYFDKQPIGDLHDNRQQQGDVGIYAVSEANQAIQVAFDNLKVWALR